MPPHSSPQPLPSFHFERGASWLAAAASLSLIISGCESDFAPYSQLSSLRVLAIESAPAAPAPGETATLTPLLYVPGAEVATTSWSWCPVETLEEPGADCPLGEEEAARALGAPVRFDLGDGAVARFEHRFDPASLARLCSSAELAAGLGVVDCAAGLPVLIRLVVRTARDEVESFRRLRLRFSPEPIGNQNPVLDGITALVSGVPLALDDAGTVVLAREAEAELVASVPETAAELLPMGATNQRERLVLSWFVEAGETRYERTSSVEGALPLERAVRNTWTLPSSVEHASGEARLIVVVRDDRGGVGWRQARVALGGAP